MIHSSCGGIADGELAGTEGEVALDIHGGPIDRDRAAAGVRASESKRAGIDGGASRVAIRTGEDQSAGAVFSEGETSTGNGPADREIAATHREGAGGIHGHGAGAQIEVVGAGEREVAIPVLGVVVGKSDGAAAGVVDYATRDGESSAANGGGVIDIERAGA